MNPDPAPPAPPAPGNICLDPATLWFGIAQKEESVFSIATAWVGNENAGASALAAEAGFGRATGALLSDLKIPGTFPDDSKSIRVKKTFKWRGDAVAISLIGCSFASISYSSLVNEEFIRAWAPVTWLAIENVDKTIEEEYVVPKSSIFDVRHGVFSYADSYAGFIANSTATSHCFRLRWSVCEE